MGKTRAAIVQRRTDRLLKTLGRESRYRVGQDWTTLGSLLEKDPQLDKMYRPTAGDLDEKLL